MWRVEIYGIHGWRLLFTCGFKTKQRAFEAATEYKNDYTQARLRLKFY